MIKTISTIGLLLISVTLNANADDSDRIDKLEKQVQDLSNRLSEIEKLLSNPGDGQKRVKLGNAPGSLANWRKLTTSMTPDYVRILLGEPNRVEGGTISHWYYKNGGVITFYKGLVDQWREPQ